MEINASSPCPCGSSNTLSQCCAPYIAQTHRVETAEQLMRSRYTAFATGATTYLVATLAPERRSPSERRMLEQELRQTKWVKLEILDRVAGQVSDSTGIVEFNAYFIAPTGAGCLHERSNFRKEGEQWFYVDGEVEVRN
jgi:SEC-C motif-containing protein